MACDQLADAALAASTGRVATLLIESERQWPGRLDRATGRVLHADQSDLTAGDLLDDLADWVQSQGGTVQVISKAQMPSSTGLAAVLRH